MARSPLAVKNMAEVVELRKQLARANSIIGWMMPYIGNMCPPGNGLFDLNEHCIENRVPPYDKEVKGRPINQKHLQGV